MNTEISCGLCPLASCGHCQPNWEEAGSLTRLLRVPQSSRAPALELGAQNLPGTTFSAHRPAFLFREAVAHGWGLVVPWFPGRSRRAAGRGLMESWLSDQSPVGSPEDGGRQEEAKYKNIREKCGAGLQCY